MGARWELSGVTPVDANGNVFALGTLSFYVTGTTTPTAAYSDAGLTSGLANPYTLGSDGKIPDVFPTQVRTKIVLKDSGGVAITTWDPIDKSLEEITSSSAPSPAYPGLRYKNTSDGHRYRYPHTGTSWIDEGPYDSLGNASSVTQALAGTDAASFLTPAANAALWATGADIAVGGTLSLPSTGGGVFNVTGASTTISAVSAAASGREVEFIFANAQTLTHGSGINTLGAITQKVPAGARVRMRRGASDWQVTWMCFPAAPGRHAHIATQYFTASGTYTRTAGCVDAFVRTQGPGGGGASSDTGTASNGSLGGAGGSGGYCEEWVQPGATETVTIGTGGATQATANTAGNNGSAASSFGAYHSAGAGQGGAAMANGNSAATAAGGAGGAATGGGLNISGQTGGNSMRVGTGSTGQGFASGGASSPLGLGGTSVGGPFGAAANGRAATGYGGGGGGGAVNGNNGVGSGGAGSDGVCIVDEFAKA